jgi:RimJ/RimL family protein N-acetyltransferase
MLKLFYRKALQSDVKIYFDWINDSQVREQSFNSDLISWDNHVSWFNDKIDDPKYSFLIFNDSHNNLIGQVRIESIENYSSLIGISVDPKYRGLGYGSEILKIACIAYSKENPKTKIHAYIKKDNIKSKNIFEKAKFIFVEDLDYKNFKSSHYIYYEN